MWETYHEEVGENSRNETVALQPKGYSIPIDFCIRRTSSNWKPIHICVYYYIKLTVENHINRCPIHKSPVVHLTLYKFIVFGLLG